VSSRSEQPSDARFVPLLVAGSAASVAKLQLLGGATVELPARLEREQLTELFAACIATTTQSDSAERLR
jgi:hypothetical protein